MALNDGPDDGVSQTSTAPPTSVLGTLAAAGRNPTDITIPTVGGDAIDGGDGGDGSGGDHPGAEIGDGPNPAPSVVGSHLAPAAEAPPEQSGVGHHYGPVMVDFDPEIAEHISPRAKQLAMGTFSGPTSPSHRWDGEHAEYSQRVRQELQKFISLKGGGVLDEYDMEEFLTNIRQGPKR